VGVSVSAGEVKAPRINYISPEAFCSILVAHASLPTLQAASLESQLRHALKASVGFLNEKTDPSERGSTPSVIVDLGNQKARLDTDPERLIPSRQDIESTAIAYSFSNAQSQRAVTESGSWPFQRVVHQVQVYQTNALQTYEELFRLHNLTLEEEGIAVWSGKSAIRKAIRSIKLNHAEKVRVENLANETILNTSPGWEYRWGPSLSSILLTSSFSWAGTAEQTHYLLARDGLVAKLDAIDRIVDHDFPSPIQALLNVDPPEPKSRLEFMRISIDGRTFMHLLYVRLPWHQVAEPQMFLFKTSS